MPKGIYLRKRKPVADLFWSKVQIGSGDECWLWIGTVNKLRGGYGQLRSNNRSFRAHRVSWELHFGQVSTGLDVLHHCDNPPCVNPSHLFLGTQTDNSADMWAKGRGRYVAQPGSKNGRAKLTEEKVSHILDLYASGGFTQKELAQRFAISPCSVWEIVHGKKWVAALQLVAAL